MWAYFKKILNRFITLNWEKWNEDIGQEEAHINFSDEFRSEVSIHLLLVFQFWQSMWQIFLLWSKSLSYSYTHSLLLQRKKYCKKFYKIPIFQKKHFKKRITQYLLAENKSLYFLVELSTQNLLQNVSTFLTKIWKLW